MRDERGVESPFARSSVIMRSPTATVASETSSSCENPSSKNMDKLGGKIKRLIDFLKGKTNVHKEIVTLSREIEALFMQVSEENDSATAKSDETVLISTHTQTEEALWPKLPQIAAPKRKRDITTLSPKENKPKKKRDTIPKITGNGVENCTMSNTVLTDTIAETSQGERTNSDWVKVRPRAKNRKKPVKTRNRRKTGRPDALVIQTCGDTSYADILKKVKRDPKLEILGQNVNNIRKTARGELLLELNKPAHQSTCEFRHTIKEVLGTTAEVRALTHEIVLEIRDIDEVTDREDVHEALVNLSEEFKTLQLSAIKSLRRAYGGTQTATISLSAGLANRLLEVAKIRIGWVRCRIREKISPRRCFKCLDFGHLTSNCRSQLDHSGKCLRCGGTGHKIKTCKESPVCMLCSSAASSTKSDHVTGCANCPYYQKALQSLKTGK